MWCVDSGRNGGSEGHDVQVRIQNRGVDHGVVVDVALFKVEEERSLLLRNRPAQIGRRSSATSKVHAWARKDYAN